MNPRALAACAEFLGVEHTDVLALRENADLLPALLAAIGLVLRKRPLPDHAGAWLAAVRWGWGMQAFTCSALIVWAEQQATAQQREVLDASRALCRLHAGAALTSAKLSAALRRLPPGQVEVAGDRRGSTLWQLRDLRD